MGWLEQAKMAFLKSLIIQPIAGTYNQLGGLLSRIGEKLSAIECYQQAIKL
jgi:tetratricopeptide (TPR) repeat protein